MQTSSIVKFTLKHWVRIDNFKGASRSCAILINFFLLVFKLAICGVLILLHSPHLAANYLLNKPIRGAPNRILYFCLTAICFAIDFPILLCALAIIVGGIECLFIDQILTGLVMVALGVLVGWWCLKCVAFMFSRDSLVDEDEEDDEEEESTAQQEDTVSERQDTVAQEEETEEPNVEEDELRFCQLFRIGEEMCLLIDHIEMCPDETAFIRVVDDEGYTPIYKRKVKRDKTNKRYIVFNSTDYYLDDKKTKPIVPKK